MRYSFSETSYPYRPKQRKPLIDFLLVIMASGIANGCVDGGHTPANRLTETYSLGL